MIDLKAWRFESASVESEGVDVGFFAGVNGRGAGGGVIVGDRE